MSTRDRVMARKLLAEIAKRKVESLRLYEPMPLQAAFHASDANERVFRGGNRGGKTLAAGVEVARALTGQDPYGKYPLRDGRAIAVGYDQKHLAKVMYRKLFKPGPFKIIRDLETGEWRTALPIVDDCREDEKRDAPPLISKRFYSQKDVSWENKREEIPATIRLRTGWEISFFTSLGEPPKGWDVDLVWFDEEVEHPQWYPEMSARLIDRRKMDPATGKRVGGKFIWSATPQAGTQRLYDLCQRAAEHKGDADPPVQDYHVTLIENKYISEHSKQDFIDRLEGNEDEIRIRVHGDFALLGRKVYPEFTPKGVHGIPKFDIPPEWTRYIAVDPGRQVCAVLFAAVPPPSHPLHDKVFIYDELYIKKCSAALFAERLRAKMIGQVVRLALIDHHAGRQTEIGSGRTVEHQYSDALKGMAISFEFNGTNFVWGNDDVKAGIESVRSGLAIVEGMSNKWLVLHDTCPMLCAEARNYVYKKDPKADMPTDEPLKLHDHLMDAWRYLAMHSLKWCKPKYKKRQAGNYTADILKAKRERNARKSGWGNSVKVG